jgi:hypothetical protein
MPLYLSVPNTKELSILILFTHIAGSSASPSIATCSVSKMGITLNECNVCTIKKFNIQRKIEVALLYLLIAYYKCLKYF